MPLAPGSAVIPFIARSAIVPRSFPRAWALAPLCAAASAAFGQAPPELPALELALDTPQVEITGRKNPDQSTLTQPDLPTARRRIEQTAGGVGIVDAERYAGGRVATLQDALGSATGVLVQPRFGAEEARLSIRGSGLQRTFHGRGLKLMQDGVPLNLADGSFDFQAVDALSARYVEVWRGANALQYGAGNLGGAINFVSPNGYNSDLLRARVEAGREGYRRAQLSGGSVAGAFDYYVSTGLFRQDGFRDHARQDTRRSFANLGWLLSPRLETRFYLGHVDSVSELPGSITKAQLNQDPRAANPGNVAGDQHRDIYWTRVSNKTVFRPDAQQRFELFTYVSDKSLHHPIFQVIEQQNRDAGLEARYVLDAEFAGQRHQLTLGLAPSRGRTDEDRFVNVNGQHGARTNANRQTATNLEAYAEDQWSVRPDLAVIGGVQWARATRRLDDRFIAGTAADPVSESFDQRYTAWNPKLGLRWDAAADVQLFANVSRSFEPPSFSELAGGLRPTLNGAQRATTLELGTRGRSTWLDWDVVVYASRVTDELLQVATNSLGANITVNAPRTRHRGLELGLGGRGPGTEHGRLEWHLSGLVNDFRFRNDMRFGNNRLPGVPKYAARAQAGWRFANGLLLQAGVEAASATPIDFANSFGADRYAVWGLRASGRLPGWPALSWFIDGRNLSDRKYAATTGVVRSASGADTAQFFPGDGRTVYAGLDWRFN